MADVPADSGHVYTHLNGYDIFDAILAHARRWYQEVGAAGEAISAFRTGFIRERTAEMITDALSASLAEAGVSKDQAAVARRGFSRRLKVVSDVRQNPPGTTP